MWEQCTQQDEKCTPTTLKRKWFSLAAKAGNQAATLGLRYLRDLMTPKQMQEAQTRAANWRAKIGVDVVKGAASPSDLTALQ